MISPMASPMAAIPTRMEIGYRMIRSGRGREDKAVFGQIGVARIIAGAYDRCENALHAVGLLLGFQVNYWLLC